MRRFAIFAALILLLDQLLGFGLNLLSSRITTGESYGVVNAAVEAARSADVLFLGSSTTAHHYDPRIVAKRLRVEVFNAGVNGKNYDYSHGIMRLMARHGRPKLWVITLDAL